MIFRLIQWWKKRKKRRHREMKERYGGCRVDGCDEWLLPVGPNEGKCPVHRHVNMKAPTKGGSYEIEGYGRVVVKAGPSPEHPYVWVSLGYEDGEEQFDEIHIDEFKEKRVR